jgi:hypothetical protein
MPSYQIANCLNFFFAALPPHTSNRNRLTGDWVHDDPANHNIETFETFGNI